MGRMAKLKREAIELVGSRGMQLGDRASLDARFSNALERLWMAYQPIVHWEQRSVYAYEALVRSDEPSLRSPLELLDAAERLGRLQDLGRRIRERVARSAPAAPQDALLFVNLHAADLNDPELFASASPLAAIASRVVLEVTERTSLHGVHGLEGKMAKLRALGFRIAIDDLGAGYAGLSSFTQLDPEFVKLDMSLIRGLDASTKKRSVVRAMTQLCVNELSIRVVSEGVETLQERDVLTLDGCDLMQGYLFAKPEPEFLSPRW
jgi:EAL domain-containing protein (putative c-di-GMP-specific phosphodiesterase class I)